MNFNKHTPYNELPLLMPQHEVETKAILKKAIKANRALAELKSKCALMPNQNILLDVLSLIEAKDSSEIENIFTTHDSLYQASVFGEEKADPSTKEVVRYRQSLWHGMARLSERPLSTNLFISLVKEIIPYSSGIRTMPGVKIANLQGEIIYTPPEGENIIRDKLTNLENFIHSEDDIDPLIKLAIIHYQFEAIHPFSDGNGRVGRIINILYLIQQELLDTPILFLSRYFIENKNGYYKGLKNVTENQDWETWVLYILDAIEQTAYQTTKKINDFTALMDHFINTIKKHHPKIYSKDLVEILFEQPYCKISSLTDRGIAKRQTASEYLKKIEKLSLLNSFTVSQQILYINSQLLQILVR